MGQHHSLPIMHASQPPPHTHTPHTPPPPTTPIHAYINTCLPAGPPHAYMPPLSCDAQWRDSIWCVSKAKSAWVCTPLCTPLCVCSRMYAQLAALKCVLTCLELCARVSLCPCAGKFPFRAVATQATVALRTEASMMRYQVCVAGSSSSSSLSKTAP